MPLYIRRPVSAEIVEATQVQPGSHVHPGQGMRPPRPGDWLIENHSTGQVTVLTNEEFVAQYELAPIPSHMLQAQPGEEQPPQPAGEWTPQARPPQPSPSGAFETFEIDGPTTPMNEGVPGRPAPTPDIQPRQPEHPAPITTVTGQIGPQEEIQPQGPTSTAPLEAPDREAPQPPEDLPPPPSPDNPVPVADAIEAAPVWEEQTKGPEAPPA